MQFSRLSSSRMVVPLPSLRCLAKGNRIFFVFACDLSNYSPIIPHYRSIILPLFPHYSPLLPHYSPLFPISPPIIPLYSPLFPIIPHYSPSFPIIPHYSEFWKGRCLWLWKAPSPASLCLGCGIRAHPPGGQACILGMGVWVGMRHDVCVAFSLCGSEAWGLFGQEAWIVCGYGACSACGHEAWVCG